MFENVETRTLIYKEMLLILLAVLLLSILSLNLRYDFSRLHGTLYYDVLLYLPQPAIPILAIFIFVSVSALLVDSFQSRLRLVWALFIPSIYILEVLVNYPNIWARDVYLHGQIWEIDIYGNLQSIHDLYPKEDPGFFLTLYGVYKILGLNNTIVANLFVLYPALMLTLVLFIYVVSYHILEDRTSSLIATLLAFNLTQFNRNELTFVHANTRLYSLVILLFALYSILPLREDRRPLMMLTLASVTLAISHPLFQLVVPATLLFILVLGIIWKGPESKRLQSRNIALCFLIVAGTVSVWNIWNYYNYFFRIGVNSFFNYMYHIMGWDLVTHSLTIREPIPLIGLILRNYYKVTITLVTLVVVVYIVWGLFKGELTREEIFVASFSLAIAVTFLTTIFSASLGNSIDRALISFPIPVSILFTRIIQSFLSRHKMNVVMKTVLITSLLTTTFGGYLLVHETPVLDARTAPLNDASLFLIINRNGKEAGSHITVTSPYGIYFSYFDPASWVKVERMDLINNLSEATKNLLETSGIRVIDIRSAIIWGGRYNDLYRALNEFYILVVTPLNKHCDLIYDNGGNEFIYS